MIEDALRAFSSIDGCLGVGLFNPSRECLGMLSDDADLFKKASIEANGIMAEVERAVKDMGLGKTDLLHIESEKGHILVKCQNENPDPYRHQPGKAHVHVVMNLSPIANVGLAKLRMKEIIAKLTEEFWTWIRIKQYHHERW